MNPRSILQSFIVGYLLSVTSLYVMTTREDPSLSLQSELFHGVHLSDLDMRNTNDSLEDKVSIRSNDSERGHFKHYRPTNEHDVGHDRDNRRNRFLMHHRSRKQTKPNLKENPFMWYPSVPPFLTGSDDSYVPFFPFTMSTWLRKPNDILLVVLKQQQTTEPSAATTNATTTPCTCNSTKSRFSQISDDNGLDSDRNKPDAPDSQIAQWPSSCIWAIVACCAPNNYHFRFGCFNFLSCTVPFWDDEVCQLPIILSAAQETLKYYQQFAETKSLPAPDKPSSGTAIPEPESKDTKTTTARTTTTTVTRATTTTRPTTTTQATTTTTTETPEDNTTTSEKS